MVGIAEARKVPRDAWRTTRVEAVMRPAADVPTVSSGEDAVRALERMMSTGEGRLGVVRGAHGTRAELAGIVTRRDILHLLTLRTGLGAGGPEGATPPSATVPRPPEERRRA
jgi:predicted transcriptional regulator